jgi:protein-S-isoprenylcysteine O-methyltransferase Ste14
MGAKEVARAGPQVARGQLRAPAYAGHVTPQELRRGVLRRFAQLLVQRVVEGLVLFLCAGTVRWLGGWLYTGASVLLLAANAIYLLPRNPEIVVERGKRHEGTRGFDKVVLVFYTLSYLAVLVVAGLDARFAWAPLSPWWAAPGFALMALGMIPVAGAMAVNRNLEPTVRIQTDRGHAVATTGPYRWVRHPMYAGMLLSFPGGTLVLGSSWAFVPTALALAFLVVRTAFEDRMLREELPGYREYAQETRYRLVPGLW